jgi:hypothetical protein
MENTTPAVGIGKSPQEAVLCAITAYNMMHEDNRLVGKFEIVRPPENTNGKYKVKFTLNNGIINN